MTGADGAAPRRRRPPSRRAERKTPATPSAAGKAVARQLLDDAQRSRDLAFLLDASQEIASSLALTEVLSTISKWLLEVVPAWRVGVLLREGDGSHLRLAAGFVSGGKIQEFPRGRLLDLGRYPEVREAIQTRRPVLVRSVATSSLMQGVRDPVEAVGLQSLLVLPLVAGDRCVGALSIGQRAGERTFTPRERSLIQAVANQAAVAIRNAQLFEELQASARALERKVEERTERLRRSQVRLAVLNEITTAINQSLGVERILEAALANLRRMDGIDRGQVYLAGRSAEAGFEAFELGPDGRLQRRVRPLPQAEDAADVPILAMDGMAVDFRSGESTPAWPRSHLLAPLVSKDGVIGAIQVFSASPTAFSDDDIELLEQVAGEISIALERSDLYRTAQRRSAQFEVISDIGRQLTSAVTLENLLPMAADLIRRAFGYSLVTVLMLDADEQALVARGASSADLQVAARVGQHRQPRGAGPCGRALATGQAVAVAEVGRDREVLGLEGLGTRSELVVPIRVDGVARGVIDIQSTEPRAFTETDAQVLQTLADQLAAALHLSRLFEELQRGSEFTDKIINNLTGGLIVTDRRRVVQVVNQRGAEMLHVDPAQLLGRDLLEAFPQATPLFDYSPDTLSREFVIELADGTRIPIGFSNAFFVDTRSRRDAIIITFRDLSEVRELQRKVRHQERLATIGTVAAGVAHEIRNPLFGISATAEILETELQDDAALSDLCRSMLSETRRLNDLVTSLLQYGRPQELSLRPSSPCRLWEEVVEGTRSRAAEVGARVLHACPADDRTIPLDPDQVKQVFLNLLLNAYDALASVGGGRVELAVSWDPLGRWVEAAVEDDGPGLRPSEIDKVFDLFYTTKPKGSGFGLALCSKIVQDHGGTVVVASPARDGAPAGRCGARFTVRFPVRS